MTDPVIDAALKGVLSTSTRKAFDEALAAAGFAVVPLPPHLEAIANEQAEMPGTGFSEIGWASWAKTARDMTRPGWPFVTFPMRITSGATEFVAGVVNGSFGIYQVIGTYRSCSHETGKMLFVENATAWWLVHIASGIHLALFDDYGLARDAAAIGNRNYAWLGLDSNDTPGWSYASIGLRESLFHTGVVCDEAMVFERKDRPDTPLVAVFRHMPEVLNVGRPKVLS